MDIPSSQRRIYRRTKPTLATGHGQSDAPGLRGTSLPALPVTVQPGAESVLRTGDRHSIQFHQSRSRKTRAQLDFGLICRQDFA
jgi:hypothetical protein